MKENLLNMNDDGTINAIYDKIVNCDIVNPTYNKNGAASSKFMLDKRKGLTEFLSIPGVTFYNEFDIEGVKYFYGINKDIQKGFVYNDSGDLIYQIDVDINSPTKMIKGSGSGGRIIFNGTQTTNNLSPLTSVRNPSPYRSATLYKVGDAVTSGGITYVCIKENTGEPVTQTKYFRIATTTPTSDLLVPYYEATDGGGLIALNVPGNNWTANTQSYITFTTGILKGNTNKILYAIGDIVYILGTDVYGSLPANNDKYYIFSDSREVIVLGAKDGLHVVSITDADKSILNKYNILLTNDQYNLRSFKIDGININIEGTDIELIRNSLDSQLPSDYIISVVDNFLFINKVDGSEIIFSELFTKAVLDANLLAGNYIADFWTGVNITIDGIDLSFPLHGNGMTYTGIKPYSGGGYDSTGIYLKQTFLEYIKNNLPTGYTGEIKTITGTSTINIRDGGLSPGRWIYNNNTRLLISKDDGSNLSVSQSNYNYYALYFTNGDLSGYSCTITINGTLVYTATSSYYDFQHVQDARNALIAAGYICTEFGGPYNIDGGSTDRPYHFLFREANGEELTIVKTESHSRVSVLSYNNNMNAGSSIKPSTSFNLFSSSYNIININNPIENKYNILLTNDNYNHWTFKIDGIDIVINTNIIEDQKTLLESFLPIEYIITIEDNFLFIRKNDSSQIIFSDLHQAYLMDLDLLGTQQNKQFGGITLDIDGTIISQRFPENWIGTNYSNNYASTPSFDKGSFFTELVSKLPSGYTGTIITLPGINNNSYSMYWGSTGYVYGYNKRLLIKKDNNTALTISSSPYYYYELKNSEGGITTWNFSVSVDGIEIYTYSGNTNGYTANENIKTALEAEGFIFSLIGTGYQYLFYYPNGENKEIVITINSGANVSITKYDSLGVGRFYNGDYFSSLKNFININSAIGHGYKVIDGVSIKDVVEYNGAIFAMTNTSIFYSRIKFDGNTGFYPLDFIPYKGGNKLVPFGRQLLCFGFTNKIISELQETRTSYAMVDLEYNGSLFSKNSYIYDEGNLFILQKDKVVVQLSLVQQDKNTYSISTQELNSNLRWLFNNAVGECYITRHNGSYNFLLINGGKTINYKFYISFKTWIEQRYDIEIYSIGDKVLSKGKILLEDGYTDLGEEYIQEVHFSIGNLIKFTKVNIIRTIFGLNNEFEVELDLDIEYEMGNGNIIYQSKKLNGYSFDTDRTLTLDEGELIESQEDNYEGSIASIQETLESSGKYIRFKYSSQNRFIIGDSYFLTEESKPIINNILNSN